MSDDFRLKRFDNVTTMIRYHNDKMVDAFNRFLRFVVAIFGGSYGLLSLEHLEKATKIQAISLVPYLLWVVGFSTLALIYSNCKSWYGYRNAESDLSCGTIPKPVLPRAISEQIIMVLIIFGVCFGYHWLQPFSSVLARP